ncbi:helix-turn-helix domain-containing protein [Jeotgalibacillus soli]|uniref:DNA-binding protein n=1 Tax=Jeotgalibacillus soli TaxID=889306 RepID=A0A0C2RLL0_9BACL|nr:helix-turn-helix transcriptional regulator [Jeotgalibacillus soli]KIL42629.1 DNA-binding protein [Jeotgalibacillus soli]
MFGERLKQLRLHKKKTQQDMAALLGISRQAYGYYENGSRQPDYNAIKLLADYFEVSIDYLITGKQGNKKEDGIWEEVLDPEIELFFKDLLDAPEEKMAELRRIWEIIKRLDRT